MTARGVREACAIVAFGAAAACRGAPAQLVVAVDTDLSVPSQIDAVDIVVEGPSGRMASATATLAGAGGTWLPVTLGVEGAGATPVTITATSRQNGTPGVRHVVHTAFVAGASRLVRIELAGACLTACPAQACDAQARCVEEQVAPDALPAWTPPPLRWTPPTLENPTVLEVPTGGVHATLGAGQDYIVRLPRHDAAGSTWLDGGRNVVIMGGHVTLQAGLSDPNARRALVVQGATGVVHIEGVLVDTAADASWTGLELSAPATFQVEDVRVVGVLGGPMEQSAVVESWGATEVRIDRLTATTSRLGLRLAQQIDPIGRTSVAHADVAYITDAIEGPAVLAAVEPFDGTCSTDPIALDAVYLAPMGAPLATAIYPAVGTGSCSAVVAGELASWPTSSVTGAVTLGPPPGGAFVPDGVAGNDYVSPAYRSSP